MIGHSNETNHFSDVESADSDEYTAAEKKNDAKIIEDAKRAEEAKKPIKTENDEKDYSNVYCYKLHTEKKNQLAIDLQNTRSTADLQLKGRNYPGEEYKKGGLKNCLPMCAIERVIKRAEGIKVWVTVLSDAIKAYIRDKIVKPAKDLCERIETYLESIKCRKNDLKTTQTNLTGGSSAIEASSTDKKNKAIANFELNSTEAKAFLLKIKNTTEFTNFQGNLKLKRIYELNIQGHTPLSIDKFRDAKLEEINSVNIEAIKEKTLQTFQDDSTKGCLQITNDFNQKVEQCDSLLVELKNIVTDWKNELTTLIKN